MKAADREWLRAELSALGELQLKAGQLREHGYQMLADGRYPEGYRALADAERLSAASARNLVGCIATLMEKSL